MAGREPVRPDDARKLAEMVPDDEGRDQPRVGRAPGRIVSEPVTDYIRFEYDLTAANNVDAGEEVRWLPRRQTAGLLVPPNDFWVFDEKIVLWNHFAGDGSWVARERSDDASIAKLCVSSFDALWERAIPHEEYRPA